MLYYLHVIITGIFCLLPHHVYPDSVKKGTHDAPKHRSRTRKRKFTGNRHTFEQSTVNTSTSAEKLLHNNDENIVIDPSGAAASNHSLLN